MSRDRAENRLQRRAARRRDDRGLIEALEETKPLRPRRADRIIKPMTKAQAAYDQSISANTLTISTGVWGTGKTFWAAMRAAKAFEAGEVEKIIVTRPAVGADEELGFFPGDLAEKFAPHWRPVRDALEEFLGPGPVEYHLKTRQIEARPLGLLRGATFTNAFIIFDEAQNSTPRQMKLLLSRIGEGCKVVVDGDFAQQQDIDGLSGLEDALIRLKGQPDVGHVHFEIEDIVRSGFARMIAVAYSS